MQQTGPLLARCLQQLGKLQLPLGAVAEVCTRPSLYTTTGTRQITTTAVCHKFIMDGRDTDSDKKSQQLTIRKGRVFDEIAKNERNKETFTRAVHKYTTRVDKSGRGNVEFIYAAMAKMQDFNVHRDLSIYKEILILLPKNKMVARTAWEADLMHYPKQQQCTIDLMEQMEQNGVIPDDDFGYMMKDLFGTKTHAFRRYQRMMYWMPKFRNANPYPVPYNLPEDPLELARLALKRMAVDHQNKISDFETVELEGEEVMDETFVVSSQSPDQQIHLADHNRSKPVYVEGGFTVWMRMKSLTYFILRSDTTETCKIYNELQEKGQTEDEYYADFLKDIPFFSKKSSAVMKTPTVHEQEDGTILAMCITGTGSKNSLASWIKWLERANPKLSQIPVVFRMKTPETGLTVVQGEEERKKELVTVY